MGHEPGSGRGGTGGETEDETGGLYPEALRLEDGSGEWPMTDHLAHPTRPEHLPVDSDVLPIPGDALLEPGLCIGPNTERGHAATHDLRVDRFGSGQIGDDVDGAHRRLPHLPSQLRAVLIEDEPDPRLDVR